MRGWSFPLGRLLGVELRIHLVSLILLGLCAAYGSSVDGSGARGVGLWLVMLSAVMVRDVARALGAAWFGLKLRSIVLLPTGGLFSYASGEASELAAGLPMQRRMAWIGPSANLLAAFILAAIIITIGPSVHLGARPWVTSAGLLRGLVWSNLMLGLLHLFPAVPLDGGRLFRAAIMQARGAGKGLRAAMSMGQAVAFGLMVGGLLFNSIWMSIMGSLLMVGSHYEEPGALPQTDQNDQPEGDIVKMRDVMMMQYSTLAASDTLVDALERSIHVLQDVFPVVRGTSMVGAVSRQSIVEALAASGNGYVQGVMTRSFQTAHPDDSLVKTLRRVMSGAGAQLLPVMEGERIVGIITPQNLAHSMGLLSRSRRLRQDT